MAFTPCARHGQMYRGGASSFFLRLVDGTTTLGGKLQFCPDCAMIILDYLREHCIKVSEGDTFLAEPTASSCLNCKAALNGHATAFFGNAYPRGMVESQWYGQVCPDCVDAVRTDLSLSGAV